MKNSPCSQPSTCLNETFETGASQTESPVKCVEALDRAFLLPISRRKAQDAGGAPRRTRHAGRDIFRHSLTRLTVASMPSRYTITALAAAGAKARLRTALRLMGFDSIRIDEAEAGASVAKPKPDNLPTSPLAIAVAELFHRDRTKPWADAEITAFRAATKCGLDLSSLAEVANFYATQRKLEKNYCRTSILTFLRHFTEEWDKARAEKPRAGRSLEWTPANVVPMTDPADAERIANEAREAAKAFREGMGR